MEVSKFWGAKCESVRIIESRFVGLANIFIFAPDLEEKCHIFIIYLEKYGNVSFRGPNGQKNS